MDESTRKRMASSKSEHWCTPKKLLEKIRQVGDIALDPCTNLYSVVGAKKDLSLERGEDGLKASWHQMANGGLVFVNPPYGKKCYGWVQKCALESAHDTEIILLVGARTETKWFQTWLSGTADAVCFLKGRVTFIDGTGNGVKNPAFFPSALAYWGPNKDKFIEVFSSQGFVFDLKSNR